MESVAQSGVALADEACSRPRSTNRRTQADMDAIRTAIYEVLAADNPMTVRQVFYQLVGRGVIGKTEAEYHQTVIRLLTSLRRCGDIPFGWIADNTRWMRKPRTYDSLRGMLELTKETYRRAVWSNQAAYVEVWLEKDALAGVLYQETEQWDVPLMVTRGYPSVSYLHEAAEAIAERVSRRSFTTSAITTPAAATSLGRPRPGSGSSHRTPKFTLTVWPSLNNRSKY
jgi:hypothetical protein